MIVRTANGTPSDQDNVPTGLNPFQVQSHRLTQPSLDAVSLDRIADPAVY